MTPPTRTVRRLAHALATIGALSILSALGCSNSTASVAPATDSGAADETSDTGTSPLDTGAPDVSADVPADLPPSTPDLPAADSSEAAVCSVPANTRCSSATGASLCVDTASDPAHCGRCGAACAPGQVCSAGVCACPDSTALCDGRCVPTATDQAHCGRCANACATGQSCADGRCVCDPGETLCGAGPTAACIDPRIDLRNCGACGVSCGTQANATGAACAAGQCRPTCAAGFTDCDLVFANGCEVNTQSDVSHCGQCGTVCPTEPGVTRACVAGACVRLSCLAIKRANPAARSGVYRVDSDGPGPLASTLVWCDMETDGGGWTLVGRSRPGGNTLPFCERSDGGTSFGWRSAAGAVTDDTAAYSLNAAAAGVQFTQVLFGTYTTGKTWGPRLYRHNVPADFLGAYRTTQLRLGTPVELSTPRCTPVLPAGMENPLGETGTMFHLLGFTDNVDAFHMRDIPGNGFGLGASGWITCYEANNCYSGAINRQPGMLMVR